MAIKISEVGMAGYHQGYGTGLAEGQQFSWRLSACRPAGQPGEMGTGNRSTTLRLGQQRWTHAASHRKPSLWLSASSRDRSLPLRSGQENPISAMCIFPRFHHFQKF